MRDRDVFLNIPFDKSYEDLYLALLAGVTGVGLRPHLASEVPACRNRLERIYGLLRRCGSSIHDLSYVQLSRERPHCPRFNMPFELGLAVGIHLSGHHRFFLMERRAYRLDVSLSDVKGYDPYIHYGSPFGVLAQIRNMYAPLGVTPSAARLKPLYLSLLGIAEAGRRKDPKLDLWDCGSFRTLMTTAAALARDMDLP